jgi:hypothetical protein
MLLRIYLLDTWEFKIKRENDNKTSLKVPRLHSQYTGQTLVNIRRPFGGKKLQKDFYDKLNIHKRFMNIDVMTKTQKFNRRGTTTATL